MIAGLLAWAAYGCQPEISGPESPEEGPFRIRPVLVSSLDPAVFDLDSVAVVISRAADGAVVREAVLGYEPDAILAWVLSLEDLPDMVDVEAQVRSGGTGMFEGSLEGIEVVEASPAAPGAVHEVMLHYVGPGHDAAAVRVEPASPFVRFGQTVQFDAIVTDAAGDEIPNAFLVWESSAPELAPVDAQGRLTAPAARAGVEVTARTANGVSGSTAVTFQPFASDLVVLEGDGETKPVGTSLPIQVRVLGTDGLAVEGVEVTFAAPAGAAVSAAAATSGPDGTAATEATLGTLPGTYVFVAEVSGGAPVPVSVEAVPGAPALLQVDLGGSVAVAGEALTPGVTVRVLDAFGNLTPVALEIGMALGSNPAAAALGGTTQVISSAGVATFDALVVDRYGSGFTLVASASGLPQASSASFTVTQEIDSVTVTPDTQALSAIEATASFTAVALDATGAAIEGVPIEWSSSDERVATVDEAGVVTAVANGTAEIRATGGGVTGAATVEVAQQAQSIQVTPVTGTLSALDAQVQLSAVVVDANGYAVADFASPLTWTSSDSGVVSVDAAGLATAEANGVADVEASAAGVSGSARITVQQVAASIEVSPGTRTLTALQDRVQLDAEARDANGFAVADVTITWTSDSDEVASVDGAGLVTATGNGATTVRASSGGVEGSASVSVDQAVASVSVDPPTSTLTALQAQIQLTAAAYDANGYVVADASFTWSSNAAEVASVSDSGLVSAQTNGPAVIAAEAEGVSGTASVTVAQVASAVLVTPESAVLASIEETVALAAEVVDVNGFAVPDQTVTWSAPEGGPVSVDGSGLVTALANGVAAVSASSGTLAGAADVTVAQRVATLALSVSCVDPAPPPSSGALLVAPPPACDTLRAFGDQALVTAEARDANGFLVPGPEIVWTSSAPQLAPVDQGGLVTAIDNGTATIRAEVDGVAAQVEIVVRQEVVSLEVEPASLTLEVGQQAQLTATPLDANGFPVADAEAEWQSLDATKVSVSETGLVTALATGHTKVKALLGGLSADVIVTVE